MRLGVAVLLGKAEVNKDGLAAKRADSHGKLLGLVVQ
jgi:hypothetical protein